MSDDTQLPSFGEPMPLDDLLDLAQVDQTDIDSAVDWWDENASELFFGALE